MLVWPSVEIASVIAVTFTVIACASPSSRIALGLERYGLDRVPFEAAKATAGCGIQSGTTPLATSS